MPKKITTEDFIKSCVKVHKPGRYSYDKTVYTGATDKVEIYCTKCQKYFWQSAVSHKSGHGCFVCSRIRAAKNTTLTTEQFITDAKKVHGDLYGYIETVYQADRKKVKIFCKICNEYFWQIASDHKQGSGHMRCNSITGGKKARLTQDEFIKRSTEIHSNKYNYSEAIYNGTEEKVKIFCTTCNEYFMQAPHQHMMGFGHMRCCSNCFSPTHYGKAFNKATLYVIQCWGMDESFYKIGIASKSLAERFSILKDYEYEIWYEHEMSGYSARNLELKLHKAHKKYKHLPYVSFSGYTECFSKIDLNLIKEMVDNIN